jgi:hypothetical protein
MAWVIRLIKDVGLIEHEADRVVAGSIFRPGALPVWLKSFDPEYAGGRGHAEWTFVGREALRFGSSREAFEFWRQQSRTRPLRPDRQPNRPLTAFTCDIEEVPDG